ANGIATFIDDATGKKAKHKAKFLTVEEESNPQVDPSSAQADPSSPWYGQPKPDKPVQDPTTTQYLPQDWVDQMLDIYKTQKGKDMQQSSYWTRVNDLLSKGDTSYPSSVSKKDGFESNDKFDFLLSRGWITPEMAEEG